MHQCVHPHSCNRVKGVSRGEATHLCVRPLSEAYPIRALRCVRVEGHAQVFFKRKKMHEAPIKRMDWYIYICSLVRAHVYVYAFVYLLWAPRPASPSPIYHPLIYPLHRCGSIYVNLIYPHRLIPSFSTHLFTHPLVTHFFMQNFLTHFCTHPISLSHLHFSSMFLNSFLFFLKPF